VALRAWLKRQGLNTDPQGGGDVSILPQENAQTLETFKGGQIDGAWVPEPWASRLVLEGKGKVLVDEGTLWPGGKYITTELIVRTAFLKAHPDAVERLLKGHVEATKYVNEHPAEAQQAANALIGQITGKPLSGAVITAAWKNLTFTNDPIASSLRTSADHARQLGLLKDASLNGIFDVKPLNKVLTAAGRPAITIT